MVHAINEIIERDAMSLLLGGQFLTSRPGPLRVLDCHGLPPRLASLHAEVQDRLSAPVWVIDMTTDLGVPAYWAYTPAPVPGKAARMRGCGASLSPSYAVERALSELVQAHSVLTTTVTDQIQDKQPHTEPYPALHRCYLADFSSRIPTAIHVPLPQTIAPGTPEGHLDSLLDALERGGHTAWTWERYASTHLSVLNVFIPGMERFLLVTDGQVVLPGPRALAARTQLTGRGM